MTTHLHAAAHRAGAALALVLLAACGGGDAAPATPSTPLPEGVSAVAADARIPMPPPQDLACQPASIRKVFRDVSDWNGYWQHSFPEQCPDPQLPAGFDWSREQVVLVAMGRRDSAADSIQVQGTGVVGDSLLIVVRRTSRQDGCTEPETRTWPRDLVRIPTSQAPAKFVEQQVKRPCEPA